MYPRTTIVDSGSIVKLGFFWTAVIVHQTRFFYSLNVLIYRSCTASSRSIPCNEWLGLNWNEPPFGIEIPSGNSRCQPGELWDELVIEAHVFTEKLLLHNIVG